MRYVYFLITLIILGGLVLLPPVATWLKAAAVTVNLLVPEGAWRPLQWITSEPTHSDFSVESTSTRELTVRVYVPTVREAKSSRTGLVIYTPFIGGGLDDNRLVNLAQTFARAGFVIAVPWREADSLVASAKDIKDIVSTVQFLRDKHADTIGIFGISYGNGPAIAAAADERIKKHVPFIISLNGLYDLRSTLEFIQTGRYSYKDIGGKRQPHEYAKEVLDATVAAYGVRDVDSLVKSESYTDLHNAISPSVIVDRIDAEFYLIHSTDDAYIPYTETMRLYDAVRDRTRSVLVLTDVIEHGTYRDLTIQNVRRYYLPAVMDFYTMVKLLTTRHL